MLDTHGMNRGQVLAALYNASMPLGMGILHYDPSVMTEEEAESWCKKQEQYGTTVYFDYLKGRVLKINLTDMAQISPRLYDRDNGAGAAQRVLDVAADRLLDMERL